MHMGYSLKEKNPSIISMLMQQSLNIKGLLKKQIAGESLIDLRLLSRRQHSVPKLLQ